MVSVRTDVILDVSFVLTLFTYTWHTWVVIAVFVYVRFPSRFLSLANILIAFCMCFAAWVLQAVALSFAEHKTVFLEFSLFGDIDRAMIIVWT